MKEYFKKDKDYYSRSGVYFYSPASWQSSNSPVILMGALLVSMLASIIWYSAPQYAEVCLGVMLVAHIGSLMSLVVAKVKNKVEVRDDGTWV